MFVKIKTGRLFLRVLNHIFVLVAAVFFFSSNISWADAIVNIGPIDNSGEVGDLVDRAVKRKLKEVAESSSQDDCTSKKLNNGVKGTTLNCSQGKGSSATLSVGGQTISNGKRGDK